MTVDTRNVQETRRAARYAQEEAEKARGRATFRGLAWLAGSLAAWADFLDPRPAEWIPITELRVGDLVVVGGGHDGHSRGKVAPVANVWREGAETTGRWFVEIGSEHRGNVRKPLYPKGVRRSHQILAVR